MGKHSIRGCITGEELNVVGTQPEKYRPKHGIRDGYVDRTFDDVDVAMNASQPAVVIDATHRFQQQYGDYGFGKTW